MDFEAVVTDRGGRAGGQAGVRPVHPDSLGWLW